MGRRSLQSLKNQYLSLEAKRDEMYWQQGRILIQIKAELPHGEWLPWLKANLDLGESQARERMRVGTLAALPKSPENRRFTLNDLATIAGLSETLDISPDEAAKMFTEEDPLGSYAQPDSKAKQGPQFEERTSSAGKPTRPMTRTEALEILGINTRHKTITPESLRILERGLLQAHHPDKGGPTERCIRIIEAVAKLGGGQRARRASAEASTQH